MPPEAEEPVRCQCGEILLDGIDDHHIKVGQEEFRFRRTTDFVGCPDCGTLYNVRELEPGVNEATAAGPEERDTDPLEELRMLAAEGDPGGASSADDEDRSGPGYGSR